MRIDDNGWVRDDDMASYRAGRKRTVHDYTDNLDVAEAFVRESRARAGADSYGATPLPELLVDRRPTPVGAIPSVFIEDETADLTDILVTGPDGEVL